LFLDEKRIATLNLFTSHIFYLLSLSELFLDEKRIATVVEDFENVLEYLFASELFLDEKRIATPQSKRTYWAHP